MKLEVFMNKVEMTTINSGVTVKVAWKKLNENGYRIIFIVDENYLLLGSLSDGDVRRWILRDGSMQENVDNIMCRTPFKALLTDKHEYIKSEMTERKVECVPVLDEGGKIIDVLCWDQLFKKGKDLAKEQIDVPVVIMAGGVGKRLDPFTKILPKPLMPIAGTPLAQIIMDRFKPYGMNKFFMSLNYKSNLIKAYFQDCEDNYDLTFVEESEPLGTAGSLALLAGKIDTTFIVSNCDILIDADYADIIKAHREQKNLITLVCAMRHISIPYGIVDIHEGGGLKSIREKPEYDLLVNTGLYVLEPEMIRQIPQGKFYHITHLIEKLIQEDCRVGVYPVADKDWMDVGQFEEYKQTLKRFE